MKGNVMDLKKKIDSFGEKSYDLACRAFQIMVWAGIVYFILFLCPAPGFSADLSQQAGQVTQGSIVSAAMSAGDPDQSGMGMLRKLFGGLVDHPLDPGAATGISETAFGKVFAVINMSLLALGTVWLTYNISSGVAQTAQDGEFLGKRFSSMWVPIRMLTGIVGLVPVFHGWALSQLVILYCAQLGVGIGNLATAEVTKYIDAGGQIVNVQTTKSNERFISDLYRINLCMSAVNGEYGKKIMTKVTTGEIVNYGINGSSQCGSVQLPKSNIIAAYNASLQAFNVADAMVSAHTDSLISSIIAGQYQDQATKPSVVKDADLPAYSSIYQDTLRQNLASAMQTQTHLTSDLQNIGFLGLGSLYAKMSGSADRMNEAMQTQASIIKPAPQDNDPSLAGVRFLYKVATLYIRGFDDGSQAHVTQLKLMPNDETAILREFNLKAEKLLPTPCTGSATDPNAGQAILANIISATGCEPSSLNRMKDTGDYLSVIGWAGIGVAATVNSIVGAVPLVGDGLKVFSGIFLALMETMTFFASMLSTYLPLLPYVAWLGAIISWLVVVIEGVVAAPLWAFAHLDPSGEGMGDRSERGYTFLMAVTFRPVLMVVGFLSATTVIDIVGKFFDMTYAQAVATSSAGSFTGLVALVIYIAIYFTTSVMIVNTSVNLIHIVPDTVLAWISNSTASSGAGSGTNAHFSAASVAAVGAGSSMIQQSMNKFKGGGGMKKARPASTGTGGGGSAGGGSAGSGDSNPGMEWHKANNTSSVD